MTTEIRRLQQRTDTAANWTTANPILLAGEEGLESDTGKRKVGNGTATWTALTYMGAPAVGGVTVTGTPSVGQVLTAGSGTAASWSTPASGAGDATTGAKGVVQLAGDLGGSAAAPTVPGLAAKADAAATTTALNARVQIGGDLTGSATAPTVAKVNGVAVTGTPTAGQVPTATSSAAATWGAPVPADGSITSAKLGSSVPTDLATNAAFTGRYGPGSDQWLKQNALAGNYVFTSVASFDAASGRETSAAVAWPDGTTGTFTGAVDATAGDYSGWSVTWAGATTKTVTATGITYDATYGNPVGPTSLVVS